MKPDEEAIEIKALRVPDGFFSSLTNDSVENTRKMAAIWPKTYKKVSSTETHELYPNSPWFGDKDKEGVKDTEKIDSLLSEIREELLSDRIDGVSITIDRTDHFGKGFPQHIGCPGRKSNAICGVRITTFRHNA